MPWVAVWYKILLSVVDVSRRCCVPVGAVRYLLTLEAYQVSDSSVEGLGGNF